MDELRCEIFKAKAGKSTGLDKISNKLLKAAGETIIGSLSQIFNLSIDTGIFPDDLKHTKTYLKTALLYSVNQCLNDNYALRILDHGPLKNRSKFEHDIATLDDTYCITCIGTKNLADTCISCKITSVMADDEDTKLNRLTTNRFRSHKQVCPAQGKSCRSCGKLNHFAKVCRSSPMRKPEFRAQNRENSIKAIITTPRETGTGSSANDDSDEYTFTLTQGQSKFSPTTVTKTNKGVFVTAKINETDIRLVLDSGATTNILDSASFERIRKNNAKLQLEPTSIKIYPYNSTVPLPTTGKFEVQFCNGTKTTSATFHVVEGNSGSLLGYETATELGPLHVNVNRTTTMPISTSSNTSDLVAKFQHLFTGIGKLKDYKQKLHLDPSLQPVAQKPRLVPFHLRKQVSARIEELEALDIIERASGPTSWVSPVVAAPKPHNPSEVRVCGDYRQPNRAIIRERHPIPTVEELMEDMTGACVFSKLDLRAGYHQIELEEESRSVTTFCTHEGLYRYKRLPFGISSASEVFQNVLQQSLQGLHGVRNIADDLIVWGKSQEEHDRNLEALFQRLDAKGLTLNGDKCEYNQPSLWFYGYSLSKDGLSADPKKVEAIVKTTTTQNVAQLRSFLGLANYCARFIKDFATLSAPLNELTKKSTKWQWTVIHQQAFEKITTAIAEDCSMAFYDPAKETTLTVDGVVNASICIL
ncbi:Retrovirus-related Pol poly [Paramuricea clavata]|uniref:Retrovirus-related Pol poly n=1 Tax=Paramuricea clavata TaxID=317549 RepID=A0A7D9JSF9_PARCT|nr:Retrovirus-related Pol poly [Paramuricea clavata]